MKKASQGLAWLWVLCLFPLTCFFSPCRPCLVNGSYSHCTSGSEKGLLDLDLAEGSGPTCHQGLFLPVGTPPPRGHPPACERLLHFPHPHRYVPVPTALFPVDTPQGTRTRPSAFLAHGKYRETEAQEILRLPTLNSPLCQSLLRGTKIVLLRCMPPFYKIRWLWWG